MTAPPAPPLDSGRQWERFGTETVRTNISHAIVESNDGSGRGFFKYVNPGNAAWSSTYSLAMERVAYRLGTVVDLPIPETYLETLGGHVGVVSIKVPGVQWEHLANDTLRNVTFSDKDRWPEYAAFDALLGNTDRHSENIMVEWNPPLRRVPAHGEQAALWVIDYGAAGLWPLHKFAGGYTAVQNVPADADMADVHALRNHMPEVFRQRLMYRGDEERAQVLEIIERITEDQIEAAVMEIPREYISAAEADLTIRFLCARRARLGTLLATVFPV